MAPAISFRAVDFPAPLGPINPVISCSGTVNETPLTARTPPNSILRSCTARASSFPPGGGGSGRGGAANSGSRAEPASAFGEEAGGTPPEEGQEEEAQAHELDRLGQAGVAEGRQVPQRLLEDAEHQRRPDHGAEVVAGAADDDDREVEEGLGRSPRPRRP